MRILTIDIGGTEIKSAIYDQHGQLIKALPNQATAVSHDGNRIGEQITALACVCQQQEHIDGVALASAGVIDPQRGEVVYAGATIPGYIGTPLTALITQSTGLPCSAENDVNAMALGEHWLGAGRGSDSIVCITIGTGIGGAVILNGTLWRGHNFSAGEIGYLSSIGGKTFEQRASTTALLADYALRSGEQIDGRQFFARLKEGDEHAHVALEQQVNALADGLLAATYLFAPQTILIGGGITAQRDILEPRLHAAMQAHIQSARFMPQHIRCAELGNRAGMIGALRHFLNTQHFPTQETTHEKAY